MSRSDCFRLERQFAGRVSHPLGASALARRTETFNLTNTPHFNNPISNINSPAVGRITRAGSENRFQRTQRLVQLGLRFVF